MPPAITLCGRFLSSFPPSSCGTDVTRTKQTRDTSPPQPPRLAPAQQIDNTKQIDVPLQLFAAYTALVNHRRTKQPLDARFISIQADGHAFNISMGLAERYSWIPEDLALIFGTPSLSHLEGTAGVEAGKEKAAKSI
ncbi:hypothetical protein DFP73DRAFT_598314 [Morchella snyderi]|nr:hypothetical protein DFP73DRAFT_598314 [Morchella snyderi]